MHDSFFSATLEVTGIVAQTLSVDSLAFMNVGAPPPPLNIIAGGLPDAKQGQPYTTTIGATGGLGNYTWSAAGLPNGLNIDPATGVISGTPTVNSNGLLDNFNVTVKDVFNDTDTQQFSLRIISAPTVTSASPSSRGQGAVNQNITINGTNFVNGAGLNAAFSGTGITVNSTQRNSPTQLTVNIDISPSAPLGLRDVTITNGDGPTATGTGIFTVNPAPTVTGANPSSRPQGISNQDITITGTGFVNGGSLATAFSGAGITVNSTTFVNNTTLKANISIASNAPTGLRNITVTNGDGGTATGNNLFTVNPGPTVTSTNPSSREQGMANQTITVTGANFVNGAGLKAVFSGTGVTVNSTTFVNNTTLTLNVSIAANAALGSRNLTVTNPDGGTGTGNNVFTVVAGPKISSVVLGDRAGGTTGTVEQGDTITVQFSAQMSVSSFCSAWTNDTVDHSLTADNDVTVTLADGGGNANDSISVNSASCAGGFNFGSIDLANSGYVKNGSATFKGAGAGKSTIVWTAATHTLVITLGAKSVSGSISFVNRSDPVYTADAGISDSAGGTISNSPFTLPGGLQRQF